MIMKNKTIYNVLGFVLVIAVVAAFIIGVVVDDIPSFLCAASILIAFAGVPLQLWYDRTKEKADPLSFERRKKALLYAVEAERGLKDDFVGNNGAEMYEHFLDVGFIHEFSDDGVLRWEVTRYGCRRKKEIFS